MPITTPTTTLKRKRSTGPGLVLTNEEALRVRVADVEEQLKSAQELLAAYMNTQPQLPENDYRGQSIRVTADAKENH